MQKMAQVRVRVCVTVRSGLKAGTLVGVKVSCRRCADADAIMNFDFSDVI
jgi:hypothetical protein